MYHPAARVFEPKFSGPLADNVRGRLVRLRPFVHCFGIGHEAVLEDNGHGSTHELLTNPPPRGFLSIVGFSENGKL